MALANEVDIERLCATMKVMAFDLDGTLARSKKPMHKPMADALSQLTRLLPVAIISGAPSTSCARRSPICFPMKPTVHICT